MVGRRQSFHLNVGHVTTFEEEIWVRMEHKVEKGIDTVQVFRYEIQIHVWLYNPLPLVVCTYISKLVQNVEKVILVHYLFCYNLCAWMLTSGLYSHWSLCTVQYSSWKHNFSPTPIYIMEVQYGRCLRWILILRYFNHWSDLPLPVCFLMIRCSLSSRVNAPGSLSAMTNKGGE